MFKILRHISLLTAIIAAVLLTAPAFAAEPAAVDAARKLYTEVNSLISAKKTKMMEVTLPWYSAPNGMNRTTKMRFWFTEETKLGENDMPVTTAALHKAAVTHQFADMKPMETDEYYFNAKGGLVFYYSAADVAEEALNKHLESRYYYDGGRLVRAAEETRPINDKTAKPVRDQRDSGFSEEMASSSRFFLKRQAELKEVFFGVYNARGF